ncbi:hypothetical protein PV703_08410 [Streptomyces sp. ME01-24h]|nr:hypothetical protein [Streptomyces sp. ME01-24h]
MFGLVGALLPDEGVGQAEEACDDFQRLASAFGCLECPVGPCGVRFVLAYEARGGYLVGPGQEGVELRAFGFGAVAYGGFELRQDLGEPVAERGVGRCVGEVPQFVDVPVEVVE